MPLSLIVAHSLSITVPTPIAIDLTPDLGPLKAAARTVGRNLSPGCVVVLESTVYPGVTEDVVAPIIAEESGLEAGTGFHLGYSPERINPGDKAHTIDQLVKVVAGDNDRVTDLDDRCIRRNHGRQSVSSNEYQDCGGGKGNREHSARPEHSVDE